jgi:7-cyano-7-deazaguanine synthase
VSSAEPLVVLVSGGVDSAILVASSAAQGRIVQPMYIRFGLGWEEVEEAHLRRFLGALPNELEVRTLTVLELPAADMYGVHWSVSGAGIPDESTDDDAVYLPGRNLLLLAKASVWCALHRVRTIALGTLRANPFADSSSEFLSGFAALAGLALDSELEVVTPFSGLSKGEVLELGRELPLEHTFSCIAPVGSEHCGRCNKCAERRQGFLAAGVEDRTSYAGAR